ncbi:hypothetical protein EVAR_32023_1 [Eumeta japonica]|uniref:Uncharacterized protein n=1 Tax=Eumeta variegata TaxID=151549 RepID=A0A4C1YI74_EUMVA|nr:hypothetical protein EVAR_32023_1 [Eumeta japonica]
MPWPYRKILLQGVVSDPNWFLHIRHRRDSSKAYTHFANIYPNSTQEAGNSLAPFEVSSVHGRPTYLWWPTDLLVSRKGYKTEMQRGLVLRSLRGCG